MEFGDPQVMQTEARAHHIHDRVHRADFVEMHLVRRRAMHLRLGLRQAREDPQGRLRHGGRQPGSHDDLRHLFQAAVMMRMLYFDHDVRAGDMLLADLARGERVAVEGQLRELIAKYVERQAGVHQRAEQHVAGDAGETIEITDHQIHSVRASALPCRRNQRGCSCSGFGTSVPKAGVWLFLRP